VHHRCRHLGRVLEEGGVMAAKTTVKIRLCTNLGENLAFVELRNIDPDADDFTQHVLNAIATEDWTLTVGDTIEIVDTETEYPT
jgi:hypothetical protein